MKKLKLFFIFGFLFATIGVFTAFSQTDFSAQMFDLAKMKSGVRNKRISSTDRTGGNRDHLEPFQPGEKRTIAEIIGSSVIKHIINP